MVARVADLSISADGNTSIGSVNAAEGNLVANLNNVDREIMAMIRTEFSEQGATVTAATLTAISTASEFKLLSGNTTISGFDTAVTGMYRELQVLGTPLLQSNTAMGLMGGVDFTAAAGDMIRARSLGAGNWAVNPERKSGLPVVSPAVGIGKHLIPLNAEALIPATTNGPARTQNESTTNKVNYFTLDYDATTAESAWAKLVMPTSADETRGLLFEYDYTYATTATGAGVAFSLAALAIGDGDTVDAAPGTAVTVTDSKLGAGVKHTSAQSTTVVPSGSWSAGDMILAQLARVPSDAADLVSVDVQVMALRIFVITADVVDTTP